MRSLPYSLLVALLPLSGALLGAYHYPQVACPTSRRPGAISGATNLPLRPIADSALFEELPYTGYPDNRVLAVRTMPDTTTYQPAPVDLKAFGLAATPGAPGRAATHANNLPPDLYKLYYKGITQKEYVTPGTVWVVDIALAIDEIECSNKEWKHFLEYVARDSGRAIAARYFPQTAQLPLPTYFTDPFYSYYPVVGISREQVEAYCRWRSAATTEALANRRGFDPAHPNYMVMRYRLPTEAEWEYAAGSAVRPNEPYGVPSAQNQVQINPDAAEYLRTRAHATQPVAQIKQAIQAFNRAALPIIQFNCQRPAPYFLALPTPGYVFDLPQNYFGLYHMAGNVAELVQEPGTTKGGSYRDSLAACAIKARGRYAGPASSIGFRCVCVISFPNRK